MDEEFAERLRWQDLYGEKVDGKMASDQELAEIYQEIEHKGRYLVAIKNKIIRSVATIFECQNQLDNIRDERGLSPFIGSIEGICQLLSIEYDEKHKLDVGAL
jgi:hypothetical protein